MALYCLFVLFYLVSIADSFNIETSKSLSIFWLVALEKTHTCKPFSHTITDWINDGLVNYMLRQLSRTGREKVG